MVIPDSLLFQERPIFLVFPSLETLIFFCTSCVIFGIGIFFFYRFHPKQKPIPLVSLPLPDTSDALFEQKSLDFLRSLLAEYSQDTRAMSFTAGEMDQYFPRFTHLLDLLEEGEYSYPLDQEKRATILGELTQIQKISRKGR